jgi:hypothetical protein
MAHVQHDFHFNPEAGAAATVVLTVFSFVLNVDFAQMDIVAQFVTHVIQGAAAAIACIVGFYTVKNQIKKSK